MMLRNQTSYDLALSLPSPPKTPTSPVNHQDFLRMIEFCKKPKYGSQWNSDELWMALNYGNCFLEGCHRRTTVEEWAYLNSKPGMSNAPIACVRLWMMLDEERRNIFFQLVARG
jgi:hypothetical protein